MPEPITESEALAYLRRAVKERGENYVYATDTSNPCLYFEDGQPSCIVGWALHYHGFTEADLEAVEGAKLGQDDQVNAARCDVLTDRLLTQGAKRILAAAQQIQDAQDVTWGEALVVAELRAGIPDSTVIRLG